VKIFTWLITWVWLVTSPAMAGTLILDSTPGSTIDAFGRITQPWLAQTVTDPVDIAYKTGAAGKISQQALLNSKPNTFLLTYIRPDDLQKLNDIGAITLGQFGLPEIVLFTRAENKIDLSKTAVRDRNAPVKVAFLSQTSWRDYWPQVFSATWVGDNFIPVPVAKVSEIQQLVMGGHVDLGAVSSGTVMSWNQGQESFRAVLILSSQPSAIFLNTPFLGNLTSNRDYEQRLSRLTLLASPGTAINITDHIRQDFPRFRASPAVQELVNRYGFSQ